MRQIFFFSLIFLTLMGSCTLTLKHEKVEMAQELTGLKVAPANEGFSALQYALPNTGLRFYVTAERIEKKRGDFYLYSERYLGEKDVILEDAVEWHIKDVQIETYGIASDDLFSITSASDFNPMVNLLSDGVLAGINAPLSLEQQESVEIRNEGVVHSAIPYTEEMLLANSTAKMAQEAARYIYRLRENRTAILSSELEVLPPDGQAYAESLQQIAALEAQFLSLFVGQESKTCVTKVVEIVPQDLIKKDVLFRFSSFNGVVDKDDLSGSPVYLSMSSPSIASSLELPDTAGLYYRRPANVQVTLLDGIEKILQEDVQIGQLGQISTLPINMVNEEVSIELFPKTGAIKSISKRQ